MGRQNLSRGDIECRKQRRRAVPFVVRGSGRSRRARWAVSNSLAPAPAPGSMASHRRTAQWPSGAERCRARQPPPLWQQISDRCSRTRTCAPQDRSCCAARTAKHTGHRRRRGRRQAMAPSTARTRQAAGCPTAQGCACASPSCRSAPCQDAACPSNPQGLHRQSDAAKGWRSAAVHRPPWQSTECSGQPPQAEQFGHASNHAAASSASGSKPQAPCAPSQKAGLLLLRESSRS